MLHCCFCCLCVGFFGYKSCGILAPWPGIKSAPPALEGEVWTPGPPGKSWQISFLGPECQWVLVWYWAEHAAWTSRPWTPHHPASRGLAVCSRSVLTSPGSSFSATAWRTKSWRNVSPMTLLGWAFLMLASKWRENFSSVSCHALFPQSSWRAHSRLCGRPRRPKDE